jgi:alkyl sulfatase BDS1-like metallo-beta-lactamase superfamily hydrolase
VGEGYGKVSWGVRTLWESYIGWFHHQSTTELYGVRHSDVYPDLAELAGADAVAERAKNRLDKGETIAAIHLAEVALAGDSANAVARQVMIDAHTALLEAGGDESHWENGWLETQRARWSAPQ